MIFCKRLGVLSEVWMKRVGRKFLISLIMQYRKTDINAIHNHFDDNKILVHDLDFTDADLRGIRPADLLLLEFANCKLVNVKLDRAGIDYFLEYFQNKKIIYEAIDFTQIDLSNKEVNQPNVGIFCKISMNFKELSLRNFKFNGATLENVIFDGSDIEGANFIDAQYISPEQLAFTKNFDKATFFSDPAKDTKFKAKIQAIAAKGKEEEKDFSSFANFKLATLFDPTWQ